MKRKQWKWTKPKGYQEKIGKRDNLNLEEKHEKRIFCQDSKERKRKQGKVKKKKEKEKKRKKLATAWKENSLSWFERKRKKGR